MGFSLERMAECGRSGVTLSLVGLLFAAGPSGAGDIAGSLHPNASASRDPCVGIGSCASVGERPTVVAWDGSALWVTHLGPTGPHGDPETLYRIDPTTCAVLRQIPTPESNISGLAWANGTLWCLPEQTAQFHQLDPADGSVLSVIPAPSFGEPDPGGADLTWDGTSLWHADYHHAMVYRIDPSNGDVLDSFASPGPRPSGIVYVGGTLLLGDFDTDAIYALEPDGTVLSWCDSPGAHPWGLEYVDGVTWSVGLVSEQLFQLEIAVPSPVTLMSWGTTKARYR